MLGLFLTYSTATRNFFNECDVMIRGIQRGGEGRIGENKRMAVLPSTKSPPSNKTAFVEAHTKSNLDFSVPEGLMMPARKESKIYDSIPCSYNVQATL